MKWTIQVVFKDDPKAPWVEQRSSESQSPSSNPDRVNEFIVGDKAVSN